MKAEILAIGSELIHGEKLDTNSQWLCCALAEVGISTHYFTVVGDDMAELVGSLQVALNRADLIIIGGGLGPTQDDLTREALAALAGVPVVENATCLADLESFFARRNHQMPDRNRVQALIPQGAEPIHNPTGTAPGIWMDLSGHTLVCLPGVPRELKTMFQEQVLPRIRQRGWGQGVIVHRVINLFGLGESEVEAQAQDLTARGRVPEVGITAHDATISFRLTGQGASEAEALQQLEPTLATIRERFGPLIVGETEGEDVPHGLFQALRSTNATLAVAESCTGGLIASRLTAIAGASEIFPGSIVCYSNQAKQSLLDVPAELIEAHGAVSAEVAAAMAAGVRAKLGADYGLSVTGIAGPSGGTASKPVGLVYLGLADSKGHRQTRRLELGPEQPRSVIQSRAAKHAMNWLRRYVREQ